jgi:hypothetical protein
MTRAASDICPRWLGPSTAPAQGSPRACRPVAGTPADRAPGDPRFGPDGVGVVVDGSTGDRVRRGSGSERVGSGSRCTAALMARLKWSPAPCKQ